MKSKFIACLLISFFMASGGSVASVMAAEYLTKPITLMVPWPAGGGADTAARIN